MTARSHGNDRQIELHVEELVLEGFEPSERYAISDALAQELERLLREEGFAAGADLSALKLDRLDAGSVTVKPGTRNSTLGAQIGQAIFDSLSVPTLQAAFAESSLSQTGEPGQSTKTTRRSA